MKSNEGVRRKTNISRESGAESDNSEYLNHDEQEIIIEESESQSGKGSRSSNSSHEAPKGEAAEIIKQLKIELKYSKRELEKREREMK
jgi:hypothetical protein